MDADKPDFYQANAEWYAALVRSVVPAQRAAIARLAPSPLPEPVAVDIGAGVGATLDSLVTAGARRVYAIEPSEMLRVGLMTRIALDDELAGAVTPLPGTYAQTRGQLPRLLGLVVALNVLGHLSVEEERALWTDLSTRLAPGGRVLVALQPPAVPETIPDTDFGTMRVGEVTFRTGGSCAPTGPGEVAWHMHWERIDASGTPVERREAITPWRTISPDQLAASAAGAGLHPCGEVAELMLYAFERPV